MSLRTARWVFIPPLVVALVLLGLAFYAIDHDRPTAAIVLCFVAQGIALATTAGFVYWQRGR